MYTSAVPGLTQIHQIANDPSKNSHVHYVGDTRFAFDLPRHPSLSAQCEHEPPALDFVSVRFARANIVHSSHVMENGKFPLHPGHTPCPVDHDTHVQLPQKGITDER